MIHFYTPWKRYKTKGFLTFSRGLEIEQWTKIAYLIQIKYILYYVKLMLYFFRCRISLRWKTKKGSSFGVTITDVSR